MTFRCPICFSDAAATADLYGTQVCVRCRRRFSTRRQVAFAVDFAFFSHALVYVLFWAPPTVPDWIVRVTVSCLYALFCFKDGFSGRSPGKVLCGVRVVDDRSLEPTGFRASLVRNAPVLLLLLGGIWIPRFGVVAAGAGLLLIAHKLQLGPRWGDRDAHTKVVWKQYAHRVPFDERGLLCPRCAYDLTGNTSGVCSECGTPRLYSSQDEAAKV